MTPQLIAERLLHAVEDTTQTIDVRIYAPENVPDERAPLFQWQCAVSMLGIPPENGHVTQSSWVVTGVDSLHALLLALTSVRGALDACQRTLGLQFTWDLIKDREGGHAIPYAITTYLGPEHERHIVDLMMKEDREFMEREKEFMARLRE